MEPALSNWPCGTFLVGCRGLIHVLGITLHDETIVEARDEKAFQNDFCPNKPGCLGRRKNPKTFLLCSSSHELDANALLANVMNGSSTKESVVTQRKRNSYFFIELERLAIHFNKAYTAP